MSNMSAAKRLHSLLYIKVSEYLHPKMPEYDRFKTAIKYDLPPGDIFSCKNILDILGKLETRGKISVGKYDKLYSYLRDAEMTELIREVQSCEKDVMRALYPGREFETTDFASVDSGPESSNTTTESVTESITSWNITAPSGEQSKLSKEIFIFIQNSDACKEWRSLARQLDIEEYELDAIAVDYSQQLKEQCHQMLRKWHQINSGRATPERLTTALRGIGFANVADQVTDLVMTRPLL